jgi:hypothetical protein
VERGNMKGRNSEQIVNKKEGKKEEDGGSK